MVVFRKEYGGASLGLAAGFVFIKNKFMKKIIIFLVLAACLITPVFASAQTTPTQTQLTQQLIQTLTQLITQLQQQIATILAQRQSQTNNSNQIAQTPPTSTTTPSSTPTPTSGAGLDNATYLGILNNLNTKLQQNNPLVQQKNLVLKQWMGTPLTADELNSLPPDVRTIVQSGNQGEIELYLKVLNGEIANSNNSIANNISQIAKPYSGQTPTPANTNQVSTLSQTPILPVVVSPNNLSSKKPLIIGQGSQYTDSLGITHFIGSNGYNGQASTDSLGITHYTDNTGYSSSTSTDSLGVQHTIDNKNNQINASTNSLGITNYGSIGSGLSGQSSKDNLGITHYTDNVGNKLSCSTNTLGVTTCN